MRADQLLVERGLAASRSQAQRLIASGVRWRLGSNVWRSVGKNGDDIPVNAELLLEDDAESRYVSRGGLKLEGALRRTGQPVEGLRCLDVGQSTGGFTDCLLQQGAASVLGVDVGHGQLHPRLRSDPRVLCVERCNARDLTPEGLAAAAGLTAPPQFDLIVGDLSFISQTLVWPALAPLMADKAAVLMLVKPQFELQPEHIGKGGLVKDPASYSLVEMRMRQACEALGWRVLDYFESPITGGDGNREFLIWACR